MAKRISEACGFEDAEADKPCALCGARETKRLVQVDALVTRDLRPAATPEPKREPQTDSTDRLGQVFAGRYRIDALIGAGPRGEVFRARDTREHQDVALKVLHGARGGERDRAERFKHEMEGLARVDHAAVPSILDFGVHDDEFFVVSEKVEGTDLQTEMKRRGPWNPVEAAVLAASVADALAAAHSVGMVHRHVKPGNIMIARDGSVKLLDFGTEGERPSPSGSRPGALAGSASYLSPEHADPGGGDGRSDLYSLGVILFEMLTGRLPKDGRSPGTGSHPPAGSVRALRPDLPPWIDRVVMRCLAKDPGQRHASASELAAELRRTERAGPHPGREASPVGGPARNRLVSEGLASKLTGWMKRR
jgi:serine/threonine-protein kinase